jgi:hypothetical protein
MDIKKVIVKKADRIIMNLPFSGYKFFPVALSIAAEPCNIHYYDIIKEKDIETRIEELKKRMGDTIEVKKINVDYHMDLANRYGIEVVPTLVIEKDGKVIRRLEGLTDTGILEDHETTGGIVKIGIIGGTGGYWRRDGTQILSTSFCHHWLS